MEHMAMAMLHAYSEFTLEIPTLCASRIQDVVHQCARPMMMATLMKLSEKKIEFDVKITSKII
jgi:hypothetical protein